MKIMYHLDPRDAPLDMNERVGWLIENSQRLTDDLVKPMSETAGNDGTVVVADMYIDMALDQTMFGPLLKAYLVVVIEVEEVSP